ncbi:MAG: hypothetical protein HY762_00730 [Planctomycetes bacterium]|nr:hypothetical protein [Planctomycetota bacterium]
MPAIKTVALTIYASIFLSVVAGCGSTPVEEPTPLIPGEKPDSVSAPKPADIRELGDIKGRSVIALKDNKLEESKELTEQGNKLETAIKEMEIELDKLLEQHQRNYLESPWWRKMVIEAGGQFTYFDNDLNLTDVAGARLRVHWAKEEYKRFRASPLIPDSELPLRKVVSSPLALELRNSVNQTIIGNRKKRVDVNTYLGGFGVGGQLFDDTFLSLTLMAGAQQYVKTEPEDVAPMVSYSMGLQQYFSNRFALGLTATEDAVWTSATQADNKTGTFFNFSFTLFLRWKL